MLNDGGIVRNGKIIIPQMKKRGAGTWNVQEGKEYEKVNQSCTAKGTLLRIIMEQGT